jgi:putative inorganic carbon (HCO3(-)) transporter
MTVGTVAAVSSRFAALLFYLWFAVFRPQEWVWMDITSLRLSLVIALMLVVPSVLTGILPNISHLLSIGALCFLGTALLAQVTTFDPGMGWHWLDFFWRLILVCLLAVTLIDTKRRFYLTVVVIAGSFGYYTSKAGLASVLGGGMRFEAGLGGAFSDNNGYAMAAVMIMPLLLASAQNVPLDTPYRKGIGAVLYLSVPLTALTVISTFSRGGFLALAASLLVFVALQRRRFSSLLLLALVVAVVGPFVPIPQGYFSRIGTIQTYEEIGDDSAMGRLHFYQVAIEMARDNPLGVGPRNYEIVYDRYDFLGGRYGHNRAPHSSHFEVLAENGYLGALIWITLFVLAFRAAFRVRRRARDATLSKADQRFLFTMSNALVVSMSGFLVGGAFIALALNDLTWLTFSLVAALDRLSARMVAGEAHDARLSGGAALAGA